MSCRSRTKIRCALPNIGRQYGNVFGVRPAAVSELQGAYHYKALLGSVYESGSPSQYQMDSQRTILIIRITPIFWYHSFTDYAYDTVM